MPMFHYEATDRTGKTLVGSMTATDEGAVRARLIQNGYSPLLVEGAVKPGRAPAPAQMPGGASSAGGKAGYTSAVRGEPPRTTRRSVLVPHRDLAQFYRQMASMQASGVPLPQALAQLVSYTKNRHLRKALEDIEATVSRGRPMSEAMARHPRAFSPGHIGLVKSGEGAGYLDRAMAELANQAEADWNVQAASRFNPMLFLIKLFGFPFLVAWLVFMGGMGAWQANTALIGSYAIRAGVAGLIAAILAFTLGPIISYSLRAMPFGRTLLDALGSLPGISARRKRVDRVKTLGALSSALASGVPLSIAWELASEAADSDAFRNRMLLQMSEVRRGATVADAMGRTGLFTDQIMQMARSGEVSGNLPDMLRQATVFESEEARHIGALLPWVIAVGCYFLFMLIAASLIIRFGANVYGGAMGGQ